MGEQIEDFNRLPKEEQPIALTRMREDLRCKPEQVEKLLRLKTQQVQELGRGLGLGRSL